MSIVLLMKGHNNEIFKMVALLVALNSSPWITPQEVSAQQGDVSFGVFYNELSPYGQWVDYPSNGYVWIPSTGPDFAPIPAMGIGSGPNMAGPGCQVIVGDGPLSITAVGIMMIITVGFGFLIMNGVLLG